MTENVRSEGHQKGLEAAEETSHRSRKNKLNKKVQNILVVKKYILLTWVWYGLGNYNKIKKGLVKKKRRSKKILFRAF